MSINQADWIDCKSCLPRQGVVVWTKIDDEKGPRNIGKLKLISKLWFVEDGSMYVYYTPTHWKEVDIII